MATLTLTRTWINLVSTGAAVSAGSAPVRGMTHSVSGGPRIYAGGRVRSVSTEGVTGSYPVTLVRVSQAQVDTLTSWLGQLVQIRDDRGHKEFGAFYSTPQTEWRNETNSYDVTVTIEFVTHVEGV